MKIVVATNNKKKRHELAAILQSCGIELVPAADTLHIEVLEDGTSFAENAGKKAAAFAKLNMLPALADDSGLCVDALNGAPGVHSARYAGEEGNDEANNRKLLHQLEGIEQRSAHFICAIHLAFPDDRPSITAEGCVQGVIQKLPSGNTGFGYDPLFYSSELGKLFAEASSEEKASISHRGRALRALVCQLETAKPSS
ncbi:MAG: RdgB/HAM1 family non-canonical purine NTP pyrophosphatase [Mariprofundus sp.]|nr:RdgB/HAM1 family non-canonical purine NTP pyrophosphatase [Mariprofundus sp.]